MFKKEKSEDSADSVNVEVSIKDQRRSEFEMLEDFYEEFIDDVISEDRPCP